MHMDVVVIRTGNDEFVEVKCLHYLNRVNHRLMSYNEPLHLDIVQLLTLFELEILEIPQF